MVRAAERFRKLGVIGALLACGTLLHFALSRQELAPGGTVWFALLAGIPHGLAYVFLLWLFGRTLRSGQDALVTRLARRFYGSLPPFMETYTRRLTVAWCIFFVAQLTASVLLLAYAPLEAWSLFVNVLNLPFVAAMFIGDRLYRVLRYRGQPQTSIVQAIEAFARHKPFS